MVAIRRRTRIGYSTKEVALAVFLVGLGVFWIVVAISLLSSIDDPAVKATASPFTSKDKDDGALPVFGQNLTIRIHGRTTEVVFAISKNFRYETPLITTLLLHGCSHNALKFFSPNENSCPACIGLSEELAITRSLLDYEKPPVQVVAVTSQDRTTGCWSDADLPHIQDVLEYFHDTSAVYAFGASSGGAFAAQLAVKGMVRGAMVGVMALNEKLVQQWIEMPNKPPIYLAPMPKDKKTLAGTEENYKLMKEKGPVVLDTESCQELQVTGTYLNSRVPHMSMDMALDIVQALCDTKHMDFTTLLLVQDPTKSDWRVAVQNQCAQQGCLKNQPLTAGKSPLAKALHRAWAFHEYCSEVTPKALEFLLAHK